MNNGIVYNMNGVIPIGYSGENETREIAIDIRSLLRSWPDLEPVLLAKRPGEKTLYPCVTRVENGVLYWHVTLSNTAIPGKGECVIHMIDGDGRVGKSRTMTTIIERSASGEETQEPPEAIKPWIDDVLSSVESIKKGYVEIDQGEENAGMALVIGEDGRVTLGKGGAGGTAKVSYVRIPFSILTGSAWNYNADGIYELNIQVPDMPESDGDVFLDVSGISSANAQAYRDEYRKIWSVKTYAGGVAIQALSVPMMDLKMIAGMFVWAT